VVDAAAAVAAIITFTIIISAIIMNTMNPDVNDVDLFAARQGALALVVQSRPPNTARAYNARHKEWVGSSCILKQMQSLIIGYIQIGILSFLGLQ